MQYLIKQYDKAATLSYHDSPNKYLCQQWLAFQVSGKYQALRHARNPTDNTAGQRPYTGQATWFAHFHPAKVQSATDRYVDEILRIFDGLDLGLARNGTGWLVGHKFSYADLSFITWSQIGEGLLKQLDRYDGVPARHPEYHAWMSAMVKRPVVAKALGPIGPREARKAHGLA